MLHVSRTNWNRAKMPKFRTPPLRNQRMAAVHALGRPGSALPQAKWVQPARGRAGQPSTPATISTPPLAAYIPNAPKAATLGQGVGGNLTVTWAGPAIDSTHSAATGYNLRSSPSGTGTWTPMQAVTSPYTLTGLKAGAAFDIQLQASNVAGTSAWSIISTLATAAAAPNTPSPATLTQGSGSNLTATWTAPATDSTTAPRPATICASAHPAPARGRSCQVSPALTR